VPVRIVSATEARKQFSDIVSRAEDLGEITLVMRNSVPAGVIVPHWAWLLTEYYRLKK
jgi:prevent-host-death family protein